MSSAKHNINMKFTYFSAYPKSKLKFDPNVGTDVKLPTPNPATQYLPNITDNGCENPIKNSLIGKEPETFSTSRSGDYPSVASMLRGTPTTAKSKGTVPLAPMASSSASENVPAIGKNKPEMSTLTSPVQGDGRVTLDSRAISKDKSFKGKPGLLNRGSQSSYYRQVLSATT